MIRDSMAPIVISKKNKKTKTRNKKHKQTNLSQTVAQSILQKISEVKKYRKSVWNKGEDRFNCLHPEICRVFVIRQTGSSCLAPKLSAIWRKILELSKQCVRPAWLAVNLIDGRAGVQFKLITTGHRRVHVRQCDKQTDGQRDGQTDALGIWEQETPATELSDSQAGYQSDGLTE